MADPKVSLYWTCKTSAGWKRYPAAWGRNGKVRPGYAQVGKAQLHFPAGHYELRYSKDRKTVWENVGENSVDAVTAMDALAATLRARVAAEEAGTTIVEAPGRINLRSRADDYLQRQRDRGKNRGAETFETAIDEFLPIVKVRYADQLAEEHITRWYGALRAKKNSDRTIYNKHISVFGFLKWAGVSTKELAERAPTYTEKQPEAYRKQEMQQFFAFVTTPYHRMVFQMLLKTGMRMQEAMYLEWFQIDSENRILKVVERDADGKRIKDGAERTLPLPADLIEQLKAWKETHGKRRYVLGTSNDTPNWKWLELLKRLARQAGLNCSHCPSCRERKECEHWYLHKFRATYTTNLLRAGIDARTVMEYTGHEDLATVLRYLSPAELPDTQEKVNAIDWGD
jgi:integrase